MKHIGPEFEATLEPEAQAYNMHLEHMYGDLSSRPNSTLHLILPTKRMNQKTHSRDVD